MNTSIIVLAVTIVVVLFTLNKIRQTERGARLMVFSSLVTAVMLLCLFGPAVPLLFSFIPGGLGVTGIAVHFGAKSTASRQGGISEAEKLR